MRILAIYRHYWPDATPYARLLKAILEERVRAGHSATVWCAQPNYNDIKFTRQPSREIIGGVTINRLTLFPERKNFVALRVLNFAYFLLRAILHVTVRRNYDVIIANTHPPILMGVALRTIKMLTGIPYILHVQDIHPESAVLAGRIRWRWLADLLQRIDTKSCRQALWVITLSEDMKQTLLQRDSELASRVIVLNNFGTNEIASPSHVAEERDNQTSELFRLLFAGNIGSFQDLPRLLQALAILGDELPIELAFIGAGSEVPKLQQLICDLGLIRVHFLPYQPPEIAARYIRQADLGIVSLMRGGCTVAYPSKTMAYVTAGCPLLAITEGDSQLAHEVLQNSLGYVVSGLEPDEIAETLRSAFHDRHQWTTIERQNLANRGRALFGENQAMRKWNEVFAKVESSLAEQRSLQLTSNRNQRAA